MHNIVWVLLSSILKIMIDYNNEEGFQLRLLTIWLGRIQGCGVIKKVSVISQRKLSLKKKKSKVKQA